MKKKRSSERQVIVVGLGRFGAAVALSLTRLGHEVLAVDDDPEIVQLYADDLTQVVRADATNEEALQQLGAQNFEVAVVGTGTNMEASVLTVLSLAELGVEDIYAKALSRQHGEILSRVGANHVVYPETTMGERVAHMVSSAMIDYIEFEDGFAICRTRPPLEAIDRTLADSQPRKRYGVTVVGVKRSGADFQHAVPETLVHRNDELVVSGRISDVEAFCAITREEE